MSLRNLLKRHLPNRESLEKHGSVNFLSEHLHDPNIWHIHRRSSAGGAAIGMFCAFIPLPLQTLCSAALAIVFRVNLPIAVVCSFISNPITIPPMFYYAHKLGAMIIGDKHSHVEFEFTLEWFGSTFLDIWQPLLVGCFTLATLSAIITYFGIRLIWRISSGNRWEARRKSRDN